MFSLRLDILKFQLLREKTLRVFAAFVQFTKKIKLKKPEPEAIFLRGRS